MMVELEGIRVRRGERLVLDGLSFGVEAGEVYALVGRNGSGKSTALAVLAGLLEPEAGEVRIAGRPADRNARGRLGVALQEVALYRHLTVRENLAFFARLHGAGRADAARRAAEVSARMGLEGHERDLVGMLSGGWLRRTHVAAAMVHGPDALVLDEPDAGLDPQGKEILALALGGLAASGAAVLVVLHDLGMAERVATRIGILHHGRLAAEGSISDLVSDMGAVSAVEVSTGDGGALLERAEALGWRLRPSNGGGTLFLPRRMDFAGVVRSLEGLPIEGLTLRELRLEDLFLHVVEGRRSPSAEAA